MTVGGPNWWKCSKYPRAKRDPGQESSFVILLGILFLPIYFIKSTQVRVFTLQIVSVWQKMSVCSQMKGKINSFLISLSRGASCRLWLLSQQPQIQGPGGTPSHQKWRLSHPAGSLGTALWLAGFWEHPLSWGPSLAMVSDSREGGLCQHKDIMRCLWPALGERGFPRWLKWQRIHLPMQETQETWIQSLSKIHWKRSWQPTPNILAWKIPWTEEPGRLQFMRAQRVRHDWACTHLEKQENEVSRIHPTKLRQYYW